MGQPAHSSLWKKFSQEALIYASWLALSALGAWAVLALRLNLIDYFFGRASAWVMPAIDKFATPVIILAWLVCVFVIEHYLRKGSERGQLGQRALRILLVEAVMLAVSWVIGRLV